MQKYAYIMSSERSGTYQDEQRNTVFSSKILRVGESIVLDGLKWTVDEVCEPHIKEKIVEIFNN